MVTQGHYGDIGTVQVRVAGSGSATRAAGVVDRLWSLHADDRTAGHLHACTQPLSFVPQKSGVTN